MNKNFNMKVFFRLSALCSVSLFFFAVYAGASGEPVLPAVKAPVPAVTVDPAEKVQVPATTYIEAPDSEEDAIGHIDFDDFSAINDPFYREGSKVLLEKAMEEDRAPKAPVKAVPVKKKLWRDAPADIPAKTAPPALIKDDNGTKAPIFPGKKNRLMKLIPADPVESKSTL